MLERADMGCDELACAAIEDTRRLREAAHPFPQPGAARDVIQDGRHALVHQVACKCERGRLDAWDVSVLIVFELRRDSSALIVVDMQNDFVRVGAPLEVPDARETIDVHVELLEWFRARRRPVVFTRFCAGPHPTLMWKW